MAQRKKPAGQNVEPRQLAQAAAQRAVALINQGHFEQALRSLDTAAALDPAEESYQYERALALYSMRQLDSAGNILRRLVERENAREQYFQLLAAVYTVQDSLEAARELLEAAQDRFPQSGLIFNELGRNAFRRRDAEQALVYWEYGMKKDPLHPTNYYDAAKFFSLTRYRIWTILYGETFMNLEPGSPRCEEMSAIVLGAYKSALRFGDSCFADFCPPKVFSIAGQYDTKDPFETLILRTANSAFKTVNLLNDTALSISTLYSLRRDFIRQWFGNGHNYAYPNPLFERHKELIDSNFFESYNYWLLNRSRSEEFRAWYAANKDTFRKFLAWFEKNPIKLGAENVFVRPE